MTVLFALPALLYPTQQNAVWLILLMGVHGPLFGLGVAVARYLPLGPRLFFNRERPVFMAAVSQAGLEGRWWTVAYHLSRETSFAALAIMIVPEGRELGRESGPSESSRTDLDPCHVSTRRDNWFGPSTAHSNCPDEDVQSSPR